MYDELSARHANYLSAGKSMVGRPELAVRRLFGKQGVGMLDQL